MRKPYTTNIFYLFYIIFALNSNLFKTNSTDDLLHIECSNSGTYTLNLPYSNYRFLLCYAYGYSNFETIFIPTEIIKSEHVFWLNTGNQQYSCGFKFPTENSINITTILTYSIVGVIGINQI